MISFTSVGHLVREVFYAFRREGSFSQNFLAVASGTGVNILIQVFVSPLLTRIYGPEGYGMYALFVALCTNIALIATLRLPQTFLIARNDREFSALVKLSVTAATITSARTPTSGAVIHPAVLDRFSCYRPSQALVWPLRRRQARVAHGTRR